VYHNLCNTNDYKTSFMAYKSVYSYYFIYVLENTKSINKVKKGL